MQRRRNLEVPGDEGELSASGLGGWSADDVQSHLPRLADDVRGYVDDVEATHKLVSDRVLVELTEVDKARVGADSMRSVGRTVFSTLGPTVDEAAEPA